MTVLERLSLAGKTAIVTGAGRGLGRAMALALADAGADVACAARTRAQIDETAEAVRAAGRRALAIPTDVTQPDQVERLVQQTVAEWGGLDVLIANAGATTAAAGKDVSEIATADWYASLDVNLSSVFFCARAAVPHLRRRGGGALITVSSLGGWRGDAHSLVYSAAKAAVIMFTKGLALQLVRDQIRVNCIVPGYTLGRTAAGTPTAMGGAELDSEEALRAVERRVRFSPVQRAGAAWELGPLAVYLASAASSYVTGEAFTIDGGALTAGYAPAGWDVTPAGGRDGG